MQKKTLGADVELGNVLTGSRWASNLEAASRVLRECNNIPPFRGVCPDGTSAPALGEGGRHWLPNGGCLYIDMSHLEVCPPETASARDQAAAFHAMLRIVRACRRRALEDLDPGEDLFVNCHASDGTLETSWGAHLNVHVERALWDDLFYHKPHVLALFASYMAAAVPVFGQGLLRPDGPGACRFVTSARAHHIGEVSGYPTTVAYRRNLVNSRDESHAWGPRARLHLIAFDPALQPAAIFLRGGLTQLVLAALEAGWYDGGLVLDNPVAAVHTWSESFSPQQGLLEPVRVIRAEGKPIGLCGWHRRLLDSLRRLVRAGRIPPAVVPEGGKVLDLWDETLADLEAGDTARLAARLDWALKWQVLAAELPACGGCLGHETLRLLDQLYGHVDDRVGLFWSFWREGLIDRCSVEDAAISRFTTAGDPSTRSGLRGELVRRLKPWITGMDWGYVEVARERDTWWGGSPRYRLELPDPSAASGEAVAALRRYFPEDDQLLDWLIRYARGQAGGRWDGSPDSVASNYSHN